MSQAMTSVAILRAPLIAPVPPQNLETATCR